VPTNAPVIATTAPATNAPTNVPIIVHTPQPPNNATIALSPTSAPAPTNTVAPQSNSDAPIPSGATAEGYFYLGNPDAQVTVIDYSDFL